MEKIFKVITAILSKPALISAVLHDNRYWRARCKKHYAHTDLLPVLDFSTFVPDEAELDNYTFLGGGSMITDVLLLKHLAMRAQVHTYFEIGTYRGESMSAILPHVAHAYSLDLDDKSMDELGFSGDVKSQMRVLLDENDKITFLKGNSNVYDFGSVGITCDLILIDGNHTYDYVRKDTESVLKFLANEKSIIVWHDYGIDPEHVRWEVYLGMLDGMPSHLHQHLYHVRNTKCAILIRDSNLRSQKAQFPEKIQSLWQISIGRKQV